MPRFQRVARQEFPSTDPTRRGQTDVAYVYMDERFQTYNIVLPLGEDTPEKVRAELQERVRLAEEGGPAEVEI